MTQLREKRWIFVVDCDKIHSIIANHRINMAQILVLHGPNLNLLGEREPEHYGNIDLNTLNQELVALGQTLGHTVVCQQSNAEHQLITLIHQSKPRFSAIILNAAAFTHTSLALRDALLAVNIPFIEVHLSNPYAREPFRHKSYLADIAKGLICGFGKTSYILALQAIHSIL